MYKTEFNKSSIQYDLIKMKNSTYYPKDLDFKRNSTYNEDFKRVSTE